jgi:hypothetical protein
MQAKPRPTQAPPGLTKDSKGKKNLRASASHAKRVDKWRTSLGSLLRAFFFELIASLLLCREKGSEGTQKGSQSTQDCDDGTM